jgi:hypothetical protein
MAVRCGHCKTQHATPHDVYLCSRNARTSQRRINSAVNPDPWGTYPFITPEGMVLGIREGRFAVDVGKGEHQKVIFLRITKPTKGQYKGCFKVQTQHSEKLKLAAVHYPSGRWHILTDYKADLDLALRMIVVNPLDAAMLYAKELERCARCGVELTDERSRWNCIGPECEKHWPDFLIKVQEEKGVYHP